MSNKERDIAFSQTVKAGKRIYYVDVKETRGGDFYLALTESKKLVTGSEDSPSFSFEKHKLFIYPEDFDKVLGALHQAVDYIEGLKGKTEQRPEPEDGKIHLDLEF